MMIAPAYRHTDGRTLHLGRVHVSPLDPSTLRMHRYKAMLFNPPDTVNWTKGVTDFGVMENDILGDCVEAMYGHSTQIVTLNTPMGMVTPADQLIVNLYSNSSDYVQGDPSTDNGSVVAWVLNYVLKYSLAARRKHPRIHAASQLRAYAYVDVTDMTMVRQCVATFGPLAIGLALPVSCQAQIGGLWDVVGNPHTDPDSMPNSWGGHCTPIVGYRLIGGELQLLTITWGQLQWMTAKFWVAYVDESYTLMFVQWLKQFGAQYAALIAAIDSDLSLVT